MTTRSRTLQALAASAILIASTVTPALAVFVPDGPPEIIDGPPELLAGQCGEVWQQPVLEEVLVEDAWTETVEHEAETERRWLVWTGGPTDGAPDPDGNGWNPSNGNPNGQPHQGHEDGVPYNVSQGNAGKGSWFMWDTVEVTPAWTETIDHPAVYEEREIEPGTWVADPDCISELAAPAVVPPSCTAPGSLVTPQNTDEVHYTVAWSEAGSTTGPVTVTAAAQAGRHFAADLTTSWELEVAPQLTEADGCQATADPVDPETPETPDTPDTPEPIVPVIDSTEVDDSDGTDDDDTEDEDTVTTEEEDADSTEDEDTDVAGIVINAEDGTSDDAGDTATSEDTSTTDAATSDEVDTTEVLGVTVEQDDAELAYTGASTTLLLLIAALSLLAGGALLRRRTAAETA